MDYAILKTGSKQYRVKPGDVIDVEKLPVEEGSAVELTDVLAVSRDGEMLVGDPLVPDASVLALVQSQGRDRKIIVFKYKRKVRYRRKKGHRQSYTRLAITAIFLGDQEIAVLESPEDKGTATGEVLVEELDNEDEDLDEPEDEVAEEVQDEPVDELADDGKSEDLDELVDEPEDEAVDEPLGEIAVESQDSPVDENSETEER